MITDSQKLKFDTQQRQSKERGVYLKLVPVALLAAAAVLGACKTTTLATSKGKLAKPTAVAAKPKATPTNLPKLPAPTKIDGKGSGKRHVIEDVKALTTPPSFNQRPAKKAAVKPAAKPPATAQKAKQAGKIETAKPVQKPVSARAHLAALQKKAAASMRATTVVASRTGILTLREAVLRVAKLHPSVRAAWSRHASALARGRVERGPLLPVVGVSGETGGQRFSSPTSRGLGGRTTAWVWRSEATAVATQLIYDGWLTWNRYKQAGASADAARHRVTNAKQEVALAAIASYIDVIRNRRLVVIARRNVGIHRVIVGGVRRLTQQGTADRADVSQSISRLALALSNLELRVGQLRDAEARFRAILGLMPARLGPVQQPIALRQISLKKALTVSQKYNPTISVAKAEVRSRRHGAKATEGLFAPRLEVELSGRVGNNLDGLRGRTDDLRAMLKLTWNLYRGGADIARRAEAIANLAAARHDESEARRSVRERVRRAYAILASNVRRLRPLRMRVRASLGVVGAYNEQFRLGRRSLLDRLDAQNELFVAQAEYEDIKFTVLFNYYTLLAATGELLGSFKVK